MSDEFYWFGSLPFAAYNPGYAGRIQGSGVYSFARWEGTFFRSLYFGKAASFCDRFNSHEHWSDAIAWGMDAVLIHYESSPSQRAAIEEHLIRSFPTPLNDRLNHLQELAQAITPPALPRRGALEQALGSCRAALLYDPPNFDLPRRRTALEEYLYPFPK